MEQGTGSGSQEHDKEDVNRKRVFPASHTGIGPITAQWGNRSHHFAAAKPKSEWAFLGPIPYVRWPAHPMTGDRRSGVIWVDGIPRLVCSVPFLGLFACLRAFGANILIGRVPFDGFEPGSERL